VGLTQIQDVCKCESVGTLQVMNFTLGPRGRSRLNFWQWRPLQPPHPLALIHKHHLSLLETGPEISFTWPKPLSSSMSSLALAWARCLIVPSARKHGLTLQMHTAHILSAHASLDQKNKALQDLKEQKNK
jgi:hypothetical protein